MHIILYIEPHRNELAILYAFKLIIIQMDTHIYDIIYNIMYIYYKMMLQSDG